MSIKKAKEIYKGVLNSASKFLSPSYRDFFIKKANENYEILLKNNVSDQNILTKYIEDQKVLKEALDRSSLIYNMYRDERSTL